MSDVYNENPLDNSSSDDNLIDTELQVRLMNLVMGEASDFERDQLQLLMEQRPELAAYCKHLEHLHGLLSEVGAGEPTIDADSATADNEWRLPADRRERVLAVLENRISNPPPKVTLANQHSFRNWRTTTMEAIVVASIACVVLGLMLPATQSAREVGRRLSVSGGAKMSYRTVDVAPSAVPAKRAIVGQALNNTVLSASEPVAPSAATADFYSHPNSFAENEKTRELDRLSNSDAGIVFGKNGVGVPGQTLPSPYYLSDDVQYFPAGPDNKLASETPVSGTLDVLALQEKGQTYREQQLAESKFGLAADGEIAMARRGATASKPSEVFAPNFPGSTPAPVPNSNRAIAPNYGYIQPGDATSAFTAGPEVQVRNNFGVTPPRVAVGLSSGVAGATAPAFTTDLAPAFGMPDLGAATESETSFSVAESEPSNRSETINGAIIPGIRNKISKSGQEDLVENDTNGEDYPNIQSPIPVLPSGSEQLLAQSDEKVWQKLGNRRLESYGEIILAPRPRDQLEDDSKLDSVQSTATAPSGGSIPLGGIRRFFKTDVPNTSTLMMTVTPRVIIPEEEEEPEGVNLSATSPEISSRDRVELKKDANEDYVAAGRINVSSAPGEVKNEEMRNWKSKTAPSPELAANGRDRINADAKPSATKQPVALDEQSAAAEAFSTFSLHVSDVSFKLAQAALSQSQWPEPAKIRIEEFVNAMDYHDPLPSGDQKIACRVEQAIHPFLMQRNLVRVSMRTAAAGRSQNTPLRLTLLLDNSGSMERPDRRQAVLRAFQTLTQQLKATDQVTLISFASAPRLLADKVPGNQGETLLKLIETLPSEGGTNIESALQLAREKAVEQQVAGAQNRIVLLTDGAVNLGDANPENLARQVTQMRDAGIAFDAAGISAQDLNDEVLEALTRQGDGRYYLLDSAEAASESFAAQIAGSLRPSAQNVKVQVEFNPQRVGRYKLLGYEKHRLNKEDFRNDQVDAAEMAAAEAGVAVYQFEIKPKGSGDVGSVSVRFRDLTTGQMVERRWPILYESNTPRLEQSQPSMQLAAAAALFAAKLGGGPLADSVDMGQLQKLVAGLPEQFAKQPRVQQLRTMIEQAIAIH